jgi:hypothetical protein
MTVGGQVGSAVLRHHQSSMMTVISQVWVSASLSPVRVVCMVQNKTFLPG